MSFPFLVITIILSVIGALVTLIMGIVYLAGGKSRSGIILGVSFIMSIIIMVLCVMEAVKRGSHKIKQGVEWVKNLDHKHKAYTDWDTTFSASRYYAFIPKGIKEPVSSKFYSKRDNENYNIPLVYPYRFVASDGVSVSYSSLENFTGAKDSCLKALQFISAFAFDDKFLLAKRDNNQMIRVSGDKKSDLPDNTYFLFEFKTGACKIFMNESRMMDEAQDRGFNGSTYMDSGYTHYWNYSEKED